MPASVKSALGVLTLWAAVYAVAAMASDLGLARLPWDERPAPSFVEQLSVYACSAVVMTVLLVDTWIALNLRGLRLMDRVAWVFAMMFLFPLAAPAFWYLHIWRAPRDLPPG